MSQYEADQFTLAGEAEKAEAKLTEQREAENAPAAMRQRQQEISNRIDAIEEEKRAAAIRVFNRVYREGQAIVRASEHGLFITLLNGLRAYFIEFENRTCPARSVREVNLMVRGSHIEGLTAEERSDLWVVGNRWYAARAGDEGQAATDVHRVWL